MGLYLYCRKCDDHMPVNSDVKLMVVGDELGPRYELIHTMYCTSCEEQFEEDKALGKMDKCIIPPPSFDYDMALRQFCRQWD